MLKAPQIHRVNLHSNVESVYLIPRPPPSDNFAEDKTRFVPWFAIYGPMLVPKEHFFLIKCSIRQFILECSLETMPSLIFLLLGVIWTPTVFLCPINCPSWFQWLLLLCRWASIHVFSQYEDWGRWSLWPNWLQPCASVVMFLQQSQIHLLLSLRPCL